MTCPVASTVPAPAAVAATPSPAPPPVSAPNTSSPARTASRIPTSPLTSSASSPNTSPPRTSTRSCPISSAFFRRIALPRAAPLSSPTSAISSSAPSPPSLTKPTRKTAGPRSSYSICLAPIVTDRTIPCRTRSIPTLLHSFVGAQHRCALRWHSRHALLHYRSQSILSPFVEASDAKRCGREVVHRWTRRRDYFLHFGERPAIRPKTLFGNALALHRPVPRRPHRCHLRRAAPAQRFLHGRRQWRRLEDH